MGGICLEGFCPGGDIVLEPFLPYRFTIDYCRNLNFNQVGCMTTFIKTFFLLSCLLDDPLHSSNAYLLVLLVLLFLHV